MRSVLLLRSSVTLNYSEIHRSFLKSSVMASRDSVPQWSPGSTGPSVVWPEILSPQWRVKSISLPLEFGLDHETTWSSGTLSNMMHRLKKHWCTGTLGTLKPHVNKAELARWRMRGHVEESQGTQATNRLTDSHVNGAILDQPATRHPQTQARIP